MKTFSLQLLGFCAAITASAEVKLETLVYKHGEAILEGYLAYDDAQLGRRPGVVVVHQWRGTGDYEKERATMLAKMGYIALAIDMYGKGNHPANAQEAAKQSAIYKSNRRLMRGRAEAGLDALKKHKLTDPLRTAAIGYCFGGTTVLEMARANHSVLGVACFHGGLSKQAGLDTPTIMPKVMVHNGASDPLIPASEVEAFHAEMKSARADLRFTNYPGVGHAFTDWSATGEQAGIKYDKAADEASWTALQAYFKELFKQ